MPEEASTHAVEPQQNKPRKGNDKWRRALVVLIFLLFSFLCLFCSSHSALYFVDRERVSGDMRSQQQADYGAGAPIALAPLDNEKLLTAVAEDSLALTTPQTLEAGGVGIVPLPQATVIAALPTVVPPIPTLTPTPTAPPTPTPTPEPILSPEATQLPPTATTEPPTPTAALITASPTPVIPSATPVTPSATPVTPSATPVIPSATPAAPSATPELPSATPVTPSATPVTPSATPVTPSATPTSTPTSTSTSTPTSTPTPTATPVNRPPVAVNDPFPMTNEEVATTTHVLANDFDPDGDLLTIISVTTPANGATAVTANRIVYTPTLNYFGTDIFAYTISDGALTSTARVTVTVNPINDAPVASNVAASTAEDSLENIAIIPSFASDPEGPLTIVSLGTPTLGTVTHDTSVITYTPSADLNGTDIFTYTVSDGMLNATAIITVTVIPINDPPVAVDDDYDMSLLDLTLSIPAPGVLGNDIEVDSGNILTATQLTSPAEGSLTFNSDGSFTYTAAMTGTYSFTYQAGDGSASSTATVTINVNP